MTVPVNEPAIQPDNVNPEGAGDNAPIIPDTPQEDSVNPAWSTLLDKLPTSLHSIVVPELKAWDSNVQTLTGKVHSEYEPYKVFKDQGIAADQLNEAYTVYQAMNENPAAFIEAVSNYYGITPEQGQPPAPNSEEVQETDPLDLSQNPEFLRIKGIAETLGQAELQRVQAAKQADEDARLDAELNRLRTEKGDFDQDYVLNKAMTGKISLEQAVDAYNNMISTQVQAYQQKLGAAPVVMGAGGGTPSTAITPDQLKDEGTRRSLIANMLARAKQQNG